MSRKYEVNITIIKPGAICTEDSQDIKAGTMTESQIKDYLSMLADCREIPENSCLKRMFANMCIDSTVYVSNAACKDKRTNRYTGKLNVVSFLKNKSLCSTENCARNIKNGKCTDVFVIENIGKKFFAYKYKKEQTKQR